MNSSRITRISARRTCCPCGFTILELLLVVGVMLIAIGLAVPAMRSLMTSGEMNRAEQIVIQQLTSARQTAMARNRRVEVRFFVFDDPNILGPESYARSMQTFLIEEDNTAVPLGKLVKLPGTVVINTHATISTVMSRSDKTFLPPADPKRNLPEVGDQYQVKAFQFRPDGSTNLMGSGQWFVTLVSSAPAVQATAASLPDNFATIQIDPIGGSVRSYRP